MPTQSSMDQQDHRWYRNPMVWMVIFFPALAVVAGLITVYIAASTSDGLVEDDYYKQGLAINKVIDRERRAAEMGLQAHVQLDANSGLAQVRLTANQPLATEDEVAFRLVHRTIPGLDQQTTLTRTTDDPALYSGYLRPPIGEGRWSFLLQDKDRWRLKENFTTSANQAVIDIEMQPR